MAQTGLIVLVLADDFIYAGDQQWSVGRDDGFEDRHVELAVAVNSLSRIPAMLSHSIPGYSRLQPSTGR